MASEESFVKQKSANHLRTLHEKDQAKRLIVILEDASLETVKNGKAYELLTCDKHKHLMKKHKKDPSSCRPDITHQCLLMLMDSPLNRAGMLQVYIHTEKNVLIEVNPQTRIPRTFDRFCGLMGQCDGMVEVEAARYEQTLPQPSPSMRHLKLLALKGIIQLLHKLSIHASDGPQKLLKVIKNPVSDHLPTGCTKICTSFSAEKLTNPRELVPKDQPMVFVVGAKAHGRVDPDYTTEDVSFSNYPLSAALTCAKLCNAFEEVWSII